MTRLHERIETDLPIEAAFDFVADFENAQVWDPGVAWARRLEPTDGPVGVGTTYELGVRMGGRVAPMTYRIDQFERPVRVVLVGAGSGVEAVDEIHFVRSDGGGTAIHYTADIELRGFRRLLQPFVGGAIEKIGRDAAAGMTETLAAMSRDSRAGGADRASEGDR